MSEAVQISIISTVGGIAIAYIVNVVAHKVQDKKITKQPKDRMESIFDGYKDLIKQKDLENDRKALLIDELNKQLQSIKHILDVTQQQLVESRNEVRALTVRLENLQNEYRTNRRRDQNKSRDKLDT